LKDITECYLQFKHLFYATFNVISISIHLKGKQYFDSNKLENNILTAINWFEGPSKRPFFHFRLYLKMSVAPNVCP